jgi:hypothetical protein
VHCGIERGPSSSVREPRVRLSYILQFVHIFQRPSSWTAWFGKTRLPVPQLQRFALASSFLPKTTSRTLAPTCLSMQNWPGGGCSQFRDLEAVPSNAALDDRLAGMRMQRAAWVSSSNFANELSTIKESCIRARVGVYWRGWGLERPLLLALTCH